MKRVSQVLLCGAAFVCGSVWSMTAFGLDLGGYAVANHRPCGVNNLPATTREMEKLFADPDFGMFFERNLYWTDSDVNQEDWGAAGDYTTSEVTANGFDGVDSSAVSYIASHGVTSGDVYRASMGSTNAGGCDVRSDDMRIGDQNARYLVLSTCQGVKIGSGENPSRPGANPSRTWNPEVVDGLNCIFGYSNNMADADGYGALFVQYMKENDEPVADSFMRSGRAVASFNIPAVICFGASEEEAQSRLTSDMILSSEAATSGASVYSYEVSRDLHQGVDSVHAHQVNAITVRNQNLEHSALKQLSGYVNVNHKAGTITYREKIAKGTAPMALNDADVISIARQFLDDHAIASNTTLKPIRIIDRGFARGHDAPYVIGKTVVFAQDLFGFHSLSNMGTVEVYVESDGHVSGLHSALKVVVAPKGTRKTKLAAAALSDQTASVLDIYRRKFPDADKVELYRSSIGFDLGTELDDKQSAPLVHQVVVEVTQGDYARRYIESVLLL